MVQKPSLPTPSPALPAANSGDAGLRRSLTLVTVSWIFGSVWMTSIAGTPFTQFAKALGATEFQFGVLAALPFVASLLSMPASLLIDGTGQRKSIFLWAGYFNRLLWIPIALVPLWLVRHYGVAGQAVVGTFLWLVFLMHATGAIGGPAWVSWMADLVPNRLRGKYFARRRQWGILSGVPAAFLVGWLLDRFANGPNAMPTLELCAYILVGASLFGVADIILFHWTPHVPVHPQGGARLWESIRQPLRNRQFLWFGGFVATFVFAISFMGQFVTLYILKELNGPEGGSGASNTITQVMLIVVPAVAQLIVLGAWGRAADRMGKRPLLALAGLGMVPVGLGWCFVSRDNLWLGYLLAGGGAALWAGIEIANFNLVLEMASNGDKSGKPGGRTGYVAVNSLIINVAGCLGGLSSGILAQWLQNIDFALVTPLKTFHFHEVLFAASSVLRLLAVVVFLPMIHEPTARPTEEALRFMTANIYNNLFNAVLQPLRFMGIVRPEDANAPAD